MTPVRIGVANHLSELEIKMANTPRRPIFVVNTLTARIHEQKSVTPKVVPASGTSRAGATHSPKMPTTTSQGKPPPSKDD